MHGAATRPPPLPALAALLPVMAPAGKAGGGAAGGHIHPKKPVCLLSRHVVEADTRLRHAEVVHAPSPAAFAACRLLKGPCFVCCFQMFWFF